MEFNVTGFKDLENTLQGLSKKVIEQNKLALKESAEIVKTKAEQLAPVSDNHSKSGAKHKGSPRNTPPNHLDKSIPIKAMKVSKIGNVSIDIGWKLSDNSPYFYAKFVEFGTSRKPPNPFLQQALDDSEGDIIDIFRRNIDL